MKAFKRNQEFPRSVKAPVPTMYFHNDAFLLPRPSGYRNQLYQTISRHTESNHGLFLISSLEFVLNLRVQVQLHLPLESLKHSSFLFLVLPGAPLVAMPCSYDRISEPPHNPRLAQPGLPTFAAMHPAETAVQSHSWRKAN